MPPLVRDDDDSDADVLTNDVPAHVESTIEADVEAKTQLKDELMSDIEEAKGSKAAKAEKKRVTPTASNDDNESDEEEEEDDDDDEEQHYEVEAIKDHEWRKKKGKGKSWVLLYNVKWKGWPDSENTLEPEENLVGSRDILAAYHHKIGGAPQPPNSSSLKKESSKKSFRGDDSIASASELSPAPPAKRQKRMKQESRTKSEEVEDEFQFGSWAPKSNNWESDVKQIQTVERDEASDDLFILMIFKNGKKSRVKNHLVRRKCPQKLLDFYEAHLNFSVPSAIAHHPKPPALRAGSDAFSSESESP